MMNEPTPTEKICNEWFWGDRIHKFIHGEIDEAQLFELPWAKKITHTRHNYN